MTEKLIAVGTAYIQEVDLLSPGNKCLVSFEKNGVVQTWMGTVLSNESLADNALIKAEIITGLNLDQSGTLIETNELPNEMPQGHCSIFPHLPFVIKLLEREARTCRRADDLQKRLDGMFQAQMNSLTALNETFTRIGKR